MNPTAPDPTCQSAPSVAAEARHLAPHLPAASLRPLAQMARAEGLDPAAVLNQLRLDSRLFDPGFEAAVRLSDYFRLLEQLALGSGDETYHVSMRPLMVGTSEFVRARLVACATLAEVMEVLAQSYNVVHGHRYNLVRQRGDSISYIIDDRDFPYALDADDPFILLSLECLLICVHALLLALAPDHERIAPSIIRTRGAACPRGATHLAFWGAPIRRRSSVFALEYPAAVGGIAVAPEQLAILRGRTLYGSAAAILDRIDPPATPGLSLSDRIKREMAGGLFDQAEIARRMGMSAATMRRHLEQEATGFRELRAAMLNNIACARLEAGEPVAQIAETLGFSDSRSFARAFRQWNGVSPSAWKRTPDNI